MRDYDGCVLENDDDLKVMFSLAGCYGIEVIDVTVMNSIGNSGCFGSDRSESCCLTTDVGCDGLCGGSSGSYGSIFTSSKGKGSAVSCLTTDVGYVGLCGGSNGSYGSIFTGSKGKWSAVSCWTTDVGSVRLCGGSIGSSGSIFTSSKGKGSGVSCLGDGVASGVSGSSGSSDGLCSDVGSRSSSKGKGLGVIRSEWRLEVEKERDLLPTFCQHQDRALLSDGWRHYIKEVNQKFEGSAVEFPDKLAKFAIFDGFEYSFAKNEKDRVTAFCKDADCKWRVHARLDKKRPIDVVSSQKGLYGVDVPYKRAWNGVEKGRSEAFGDYDASFDELQWYREAVKNSDPESVFEIEGHFKGSLLSASAKDGDKGLFPLCIGVVDSESNENWLWFMEKLRGILDGDTRSIVFVSDRNAGIKAVVPKVFPLGFHGYCLYHLKNNLHGRLTGGRNKYKERVVSLFSLCAYAPNEMKFNEEMARLKKAGGESRITNFLADLPYEHWANAFFPGQQYGEMWSNLAEGFNSWIEKERHLPITQLVDRVRIKLMEQMCCRKQTAAKWRQVLCPTMDEALAIAFQESKAWEVKFSSPDVLEVLCNPSVKVDIGRYSCTCTQWQLNGVPCVHAVCAIKKSGKSLNACVEHYFHVECYREAYSRPIMPVPTLWKPDVAGDAVILPHFSRKPPRRNKKKMI
ncbi:hypothetical protein RHMOL_Rhmol04G0171700 [Rhododendron molle]|uniref:Uncharacterized protein n=1 Tax=Rhododendron molle TaxID=49168 RepID=A0ACC0P368_RHOML|nr:hypothetical protein RHMOL_Rhmol04G0171700 [Rhododendron molle]